MGLSVFFLVWVGGKYYGIGDIIDLKFFWGCYDMIVRMIDLK